MMARTSFKESTVSIAAPCSANLRDHGEDFRFWLEPFAKKIPNSGRR